MFGVKNYFSKSQQFISFAALAFLLSSYDAYSMDLPPEEDIRLVGIKKLADAGDVNAQIQLFNMYCYGDGVPKNIKTALDYGELASARGTALERYDFAFSCRLSEDYERSFRIFKRLADEGDINGQLMVSSIYRDGDGVPQNLEEALEYCYRAINQGRVESLSQGRVEPLGMLSTLYTDMGNYYLATETLIAAAKDEKDAPYLLANLYLKRESVASSPLNEYVPQDTLKGLHYLKLAANNGLAEASFDLANIYSKGLYGVPQNEVAGSYYLLFAETQGSDQAKYELALICEKERERRARNTQEK